MTEINVELPKGLKLREQNPECNKSGHMCALFNGQKACLIPLKPKTDSEGNLEIFEIKPCIKEGKKGLEINE
jgi:hypothetical protein